MSGTVRVGGSLGDVPWRSQPNVTHPARWEASITGSAPWGGSAVTSDGAAGLKWGHDHRWVAGDEVDAVITVAVRLPARPGVMDDCRGDERVEEIAAWAPLTAGERRALDDTRWKRLDDPGSVTAAESARAGALAERDVEVALFVGDRLCGRSADRGSTG